MPMKIALSGRLFERDYKENIPLKEFIKIASDIGYKGIELRRTQVSLDTSSAKVKEYISMIKDSGLEVVCMETRGYPVLDDEDIFIQFLELAKKFDCQIIKIVEGQGIRSEKIRRCAETACKYGIKIGLNNHIGTEDNPYPTETIERTVDFLKEVDHSNFGILYDSCHLFISGSDYIGGINKIKDKIFYVLVQYIVETKREDAEIRFRGRYFRSGIIGEPDGPDFNKIFKVLKQIGYAGYIGVITPMLKNYSSKLLAEVYYQKVKKALEEI